MINAMVIGVYITFITFFFMSLLGAIFQPWTWLHKVAIGIDMLAAVIVLRRFDITLSAWAGVRSQQGFRPAIWLRTALEAIDPNHCAQAVEADRERAQDTLTFLSTFDHGR